MSEPSSTEVDLPVAPADDVDISATQTEPGEAAPMEAAEQPTGSQDLLDSVERTGNPRVDDAVALLGELHARPTDEHAEVFENVHRGLQAALTDLDRE